MAVSQLKEMGEGVPDFSDASQPWRDEDNLRELYHGHQMTLSETAECLGCSSPTVIKWMDEYGIERRSSGEACIPAKLRSREYVERVWSDEEWLIGEIADDCDCVNRTVHKAVKRFDLPRRTPDTPRTLKSPEAVRCLYIEKNLSQSEIAELCDCGQWTVGRAVKRHGLETEYIPPTGKEHFNWRGGWTGYYGPGWQTRRREVIERDNEKCQRCSMTEEEHQEKWNRTLSVHHIIPHRTFDSHEEANRDVNLITLCWDCHGTMEGLPIDNRHNEVDSGEDEAALCD